MTKGIFNTFQNPPTPTPKNHPPLPNHSWKIWSEAIFSLMMKKYELLQDAGFSLLQEIFNRSLYYCLYFALTVSKLLCRNICSHNELSGLKMLNAHTNVVKAIQFIIWVCVNALSLLYLQLSSKWVLKSLGFIILRY